MAKARRAARKDPPQKRSRPAKGREGVLKGFYHAYRGVVSAMRTQRNMRFHAAAAALALTAGLVLGVSRVELAVIVIVVAAVLAAEMFNTALEFAVDLVTEEYHPLAKLAKDVSAGAVLVTSIGAAAVGALILLDDLLAFLADAF